MLDLLRTNTPSLFDARAHRPSPSPPDFPGGNDPRPRRSADREIDLGVLAVPASGSEVHTVPIEEDLGLFLPRSHPLAARSVLTVADLASLSLCARGREDYRIGLDAAAAAAGVTLHPRAELDSLRLIGPSWANAAASPFCRQRDAM